MRPGRHPGGEALWAARVVLVVAVGLFNAGCLATPDRPLMAGADPADPRATVPATAYPPVLRGYESQRPVEPQSWRERNERVAPQDGR